MNASAEVAERLGFAHQAVRIALRTTLNPHISDGSRHRCQFLVPGNQDPSAFNMNEFDQGGVRAMRSSATQVIVSSR